MKKQIPLIFSGLIIIIIAFILQLNDKATNKLTNKPLIETFDLASLTALKISDVSGTVIQAQKALTDEGTVHWQHSNLDNYPVKIQDLSQFVQTLKDARIIEAKTKVAEKHGQLGLNALNDQSSVDSKANTGTQLALTNDTQTLTLLLGHTAKSSGGRYVRFANNDQTWLVDNALTTPSSATRWIDKKLFTEFTMLDIQQIKKSGADGFSLTKADQSAVGFSLAELPKNAVAKPSEELASLASSLAGLRMNAPTEFKADFWQTDLANQFQVNLFNGLKFEIKLKQNNDKSWLSATARGTDDASELAANDFNSRFGQWQYQIANYSFDSLNKNIKDMLVDTQSSTE
ncbi:DUF4340 domain-containing protein [Algibacillus agarilyticus]|uniref:DUF4340 domain-containing protein n=1 Tax=Algibacillus agarilyticus TaxID=2234133 RepID=UPI000DCFBC5E|nr:DUF4340 domain-containing protein [Algibacillus agarilyticus]